VKHFMVVPYPTYTLSSIGKCVMCTWNQKVFMSAHRFINLKKLCQIEIKSKNLEKPSANPHLRISKKIWNVRIKAWGFFRKEELHKTSSNMVKMFTKFLIWSVQLDRVRTFNPIMILKFMSSFGIGTSLTMFIGAFWCHMIS
jgi:hypothetical protein